MIMSPFLIGLCFMIHFAAIGQSESVESLFDQRKYEQVIKILAEKQGVKELNYREYLLLSRSYGRERQFGNGYVLADEMIEKAIREQDSLNLLVAFNMKAEHLTDLNRIEEGVTFCDSITPYFQVRDSIEFMKLCFKCGMLSYYNKDYQKAYDIYKKITKKEYKALSLYANNFAIILKELEKYDEAVTLLKNILYLRKKNNDTYNVNLNVPYSNIAAIYLEKRDLINAEIYLDSAYAAWQEGSRLISKVRIFDHYHNLHSLLGNLELAGSYLDSVFIVNELLLEARVEEKILSIGAANKNETLLIKRVSYVGNQLTASKNQILKGTIVLLTLILILILILFFFKYRQIQSSYKNALLIKRLSWTQLKPTYLAESYAYMHQVIKSENPQSIPYLSEFSRFLRLVLENSRKSLLTIGEEINTIKYYLKIKQLEIGSHFTFQVQIDEGLEEQELLVPPMLIQSFVEQIVADYEKQTENLAITLVVTFKDKKLLCIITDYSINPRSQHTQAKGVLATLDQTKALLDIYSQKLKTTANVAIEHSTENQKECTKIILQIPYQIDDD